MKTFLIILISLIVIAVSALWYFSDTVSASIAKIYYGITTKTGLVAYWNFDDCDTCSTATDLSGNRNTGTFTADAAHTANGKINRGATFDGTGDYILVNDSASLDLTNAITVSAWFNLSSLTCDGTGGASIVSKHNSATTKDGYTVFYVCSDDKIYWQGGDGTTWASLSIASAKTFSETGIWHHVAGTFDGTTGYLYADGELTGSDTSAALSDNNQNLWIGESVNDNGAFFNGKLDEVRIYNRVLSAAEVKTLYNQGSAKFTIKSANNTGLVAYWNFDDCDTCSTANDLSGNRNHGTFTADAAHTANGKINRGATFDGTGDYILVNDSATLDLTNAITVSAWFNLNSLTCTGINNAGSIISKHDNVTTNDGYALTYVCTDDKMYFQGGDGTTWASLSIASAKTFSETGRWYHVAATFDGTTGYLYAEGELTGSDTSAAFSDNNKNLWIGGDVNTNSNFLNAKIDEIRVYNRVLSAAEVKTLYNQGSAKFTIKSANNTGLIGYWNFDDCDTCSTAIDMSGNGNTGTFQADAAHTANGKINRGATFDGTGDYIDVGDKSIFEFTDGAGTDKPFSISAWIKLSDFGSGRILISKWATSNYEWNAQYSSNGLYMILYGDTGATIYIGRSYDGFTSATYLGKYAHFVTTYSGNEANSGIKLYLDGVQVDNANFSAGSYTGLTGGTASLEIGSRNVGQVPWNGTIDEVRIYNRVLSAAEIKTLYQSGR